MRNLEGDFDDSKNPKYLGVIAQELESISPKLVHEFDPRISDIKTNAAFGTLYEDGDEIPEGKKIGDVKEVKETPKKEDPNLDDEGQITLF